MHFRGQSSSAFQLIAMAPEPKSKAWAELTDALGFSDATPGERREGAEGALPMGGIVEGIGVEDYPELLVRLDKPTSGVAHLFPMPMGGQVLLSTRFYLYGDQAAAAVARDGPVWRAWMEQRFPPQ
jgi:hypothetical protein